MTRRPGRHEPAARPFTLDHTRLRAELKAFKAFLGPEDRERAERADVLHFFRRHRNLSSLIGLSHTPLITPTLLKDELGLVGDHACDLAIGNEAGGQFCFVEFEDARKGSVFKAAKRGAPEWGARIERGLSQIIDWFYTLDDLRRTAKFRALFGSDLADYGGLLVVGRDGHLDGAMKERLRWRSMNLQVAGKRVSCQTFDGLYRDLAERIALLV